MGEQKSLFNTDDFTSYSKEWEGMPEFISKDKKPFQQIIVSFRNYDDVKSFAKLLGLKVTPKSNSTWYPARKIDKGSFYLNKKWGTNEE